MVGTRRSATASAPAAQRDGLALDEIYRDSGSAAAGGVTALSAPSDANKWRRGGGRAALVRSRSSWYRQHYGKGSKTSPAHLSLQARRSVRRPKGASRGTIPRPGRLRGHGGAAIGGELRTLFYCFCNSPSRNRNKRACRTTSSSNAIAMQARRSWPRASAVKAGGSLRHCAMAAALVDAVSVRACLSNLAQSAKADIGGPQKGGYASLPPAAGSLMLRHCRPPSRILPVIAGSRGQHPVQNSYKRQAAPSRTAW